MKSGLLKKIPPIVSNIPNIIEIANAVWTDDCTFLLFFAPKYWETTIPAPTAAPWLKAINR